MNQLIGKILSEKNKKRIILMIQARVESNRLPGKVLKTIEGKPMIWHVINRVKKIPNIQQIVLITTEKKEDEELEKIAKAHEILFFRGDENDVLNRHYQCAITFKAEHIIRITGDCPLIDPTIIQSILEFYLENDYDYVSNTIKPTFPDGLDTEIFSFKILRNCNEKATLPSEREHVTPYITKNSEKFKIFNYENKKNLAFLRWTVDEESDLLFVRKIYEKMKPNNIFTTQQILNLINEFPELSQINKGIKRNEGWKHAYDLDKEIKKANS